MRFGSECIIAARSGRQDVLGSPGGLIAELLMASPPSPQRSNAFCTAWIEPLSFLVNAAISP